MHGPEFGNLTMRTWARKEIAVRLFCALALFMLGFSGHAVAGHNLDRYGAEYRLPDGTFASMCLPSEEHGAPDNDSRHCDTCVMSAGHLFMPPDSVIAFGVQSLSRERIRPAAVGNPRRILSHHRQSRGPPLNA
ncbi:MAG: hypothetical protein JWM58_1027 [Rhizobium sp.]|nr:hypothetical protein [Rhizobium sp.]